MRKTKAEEEKRARSVKKREKREEKERINKIRKFIALFSPR